VRSLQTLAASPSLPWVLIAVGVVLRVARYLDNRSLWLDESFLALNLINRSFSGLLDPLDFQQGAPTGFLMAEKLSVGLLGESEYALRLLPLVVGVVSLFLFWEVARRWLARAAAVMGLALFVFLEPLIYYSSETKQYAFDVAAALVLLLAFSLVLKREHSTWATLAVLAGAGVVVMWFSYPTVFVLAGIGIALVIAALARWEATRLRELGLLAAAWLVSFAVLYGVSIRKTGAVQKEIFGSEAEGGGERLKQLVKAVYNSFATTAGFHRSLTALLAFVLVVGAASMFVRRREPLLAVVFTFAVALGAAAADKYPFSGRFSLFLVPLALLLLAEGLNVIWERTQRSVPLAGAAVVALALVPPMALAVVRLVQPPRGEDIKPVVAEIADRWSDGDTLYLHYPSQFAFRYYAACEGCDPVPGDREMEDLWPIIPADTSGEDEEPALVTQLPQLVVGQPAGDNLEGYFEDLESLRGKRVWLLFSHAVSRQGLDEESFFLVELDRMGQQLDSVDSSGAAAYLYDVR
jgi:hypothetical protein